MRLCGMRLTQIEREGRLFNLLVVETARQPGKPPNKSKTRDVTFDNSEILSHNF